MIPDSAEHRDSQEQGNAAGTVGGAVGVPRGGLIEVGPLESWGLRDEAPLLGRANPGGVGGEGSRERGQRTEGLLEQTRLMSSGCGRSLVRGDQREAVTSRLMCRAVWPRFCLSLSSTLNAIAATLTDV